MEGVYRSEDWNDRYSLIPEPTQDWEAPTPKNEEEYEKESPTLDIVVDPRLHNEPQEDATKGGSHSQTAPRGPSARTKALRVLGQLRNCNDLLWRFSRMLGEAARAYTDPVQDFNQAETPSPSQHLGESTLEDTSIPIDPSSCNSPHCNLQTGATVIASHEKTALQSAVEDRNLEEVKVLLKAVPHACTCTESSALDLGWALRRAAGNGHLEVVTVLLEAGADVSAPAPQLDGLQTLYEAVKHGHPEVVDALLKAGANVDNLGCLGETALREAVNQGNLEVVKILLKGGADVNAPTPFGFCRTVLQAAAGQGHLEIVNALLEAGADANAPTAPMRMKNANRLVFALDREDEETRSIDTATISGREALQAAAEGGNMEVMNILLKAGADVNGPACQNYGRTALQAAAGRGNLEAVDFLLRAGADVNAAPAECTGRTALQAAAEQGNLEVVDALLKAGADVNTPPGDSNGRAALQAAAEKGHLGVVNVLLAAGADANIAASPFCGRTPLQAAMQKQYPEILNALLKAGADPNLTNGNQHPLYEAASNGNLETVKILLKAGVKINDIHQEPVLVTAADKGHLELVKLLLEAGADVNISLGQCGETALQAAASRGNLGIVNALLEAGADVNAAAPPQNGRTALQAAVYQENLEVANVFLKAGADVIAPPSESHETPLQALSNGRNLEMLDLLLPYINGEPGRAALNDVMELGSPPVQGRLLARLLEISQETERKAGQKRSFWMPWG